jgi:hypothetical protein
MARINKRPDRSWDGTLGHYFFKFGAESRLPEKVASTGNSWITALESVSSANALLFSTFQINLCDIAFHNNCCSERP